jgi:rhodanese-related sulfurtransferase
MVNVDNQEFKKLMDGDILLLDVRTEEEYAAGYIEGAKLIPVGELESRIEEISDFKDKPVLVYCRSGNRSVTASNILLDKGFTTVYNLKNGYASWIAEIVQ